MFKIARQKTPRYSCDFETTTDPMDCRVWAWVAINIYDTNERFYGNIISTFNEWLQTGDKVIYFHNLKFDGEFELCELINRGMTFNKDSRKLGKNEFSTLISDKGQFYTMAAKFESASIRFIDSLKLLPFSVDAVAKGFKLPFSKLKIDYSEKRKIGHELTPLEKDYITNDALIIACALRILFDQGFNKITAGSNAFSFYKSKTFTNEKQFRRVFPVLDCDAYLRKAYKGGFTYASPQFQNKIVGDGRVYDVNSLYPFALHSPHVYPFGQAVYFVGEYEQNKRYPLYFQKFICQFRVKPQHLPTIQLKNSTAFIETEYVTDSGSRDIELTLTSIDLRLFFDHYDVFNLRYVDGYMFAAQAGLFDSYIDHWYKVKSESKASGNAAMYILSKLMQNSLYGKFATNPQCASKYPQADNDGVMHYIKGDNETRESIYVPVGAFCTSYARDVTIRAAQANFNRFAYADTDSLHLMGDYDPPNIEIDSYKLGAFKHEGTFTEAKYLRAKMYMEKIREPNDAQGTEKWKVTGAGMPESCKANVTIDKFVIGTHFHGKLKPKHVRGGIVLLETPFTIRP